VTEGGQESEVPATRQRQQHRRRRAGRAGQPCEGHAPASPSPRAVAVTLDLAGEKVNRAHRLKISVTERGSLNQKSRLPIR
jgi:hypothetical protein